MQIVHLSSECPPQPVFGLGRYVYELALEQGRQGHEVKVITNSYGELPETLTTQGITVHRVLAPPPPKAPASSAMLLHFNLQLVERYMELVAQGSRCPDVVCAHDWLTVPAAFHLGRLLKRPVITTFHDVVFNKVVQQELSLEDQYVAGVENWACHFSAQLIVLSNTVRDELIQAYHAERNRVAVIPGGVSIQPLTDSELAVTAAWRRKFAADTEDLIAFAGRFDPEKGIFTLLDALRLLKTRLQNWKVAIIGSGTLKPALEDYCRNHALRNDVVLHDYLSQADLRHVYGAADIFCMPSDYEPFGLVALEAQRLGTPVVVSDTGGLSECLRATEGGLAFKPGNPQELALQLERLLRNEGMRSELGLKGQHAVARKFNWETVTRAIEQTYRSCVNAGAPGNIVPPAWDRPLPRNKSNRAVETPSTVAPNSKCNVLFFWRQDRIEQASSLLIQLAESHACRSLQSQIFVVPVLTNDAAGRLPLLQLPPNVHIVDLQSPVQINQLLQDACLLVVERELGPSLTQTGVVQPRLIPVLWTTENPTTLVLSDGSKLSVNELVPFVNKLLCDDSLRSHLAPQLFNPFADTTWTPINATRVLHVVPQIVTGGAETTLLELIRGTREFDHHILCLGVLEGPLPAELKHSGATLHSLASDRIEAILQCLHAIKPKILHLHSMSYIPAWMAVHRRLKDATIIETEHVVNIGSGHFGPVDVVVGVSKAVVRAHDRYTQTFREAASNYQVIYNGIDPADYQNLPSRSKARAVLNLPQDRPILGRVSALTRNKLPIEALESIPFILKKLPNALFVIVGDGPDRQPAEEWVRRNELQDSVVFLGERRDIPQVLAAFDVFAYYTMKDALGNVILEAVAAGVPVVTTDVEGTKEALGRAPGQAVKLGDYEAFAAAVARFAAPNSPRKYQLESKFTREHMAHSYAHLYGELIKDDSERSAPQTASRSDQKLLIKFPTRSRPETFFNTLKLYIDNLSGRIPYELVISCDEDDASMNNHAVRRRLKGIANLTYYFRPSAGKVSAINSDLDKHADFSVLLVACDDMTPQIKNYDELIVTELLNNFPDGDGVLFFNDGYRGRQLNTTPILGQRYYQRFNYIYNPEYKSLWCDNEFTEVADLLKRQRYDERVVFRHEHPANTGKGFDPLYKHNDTFMDSDAATYQRRRAQNFELFNSEARSR